MLITFRKAMFALRGDMIIGQKPLSLTRALACTVPSAAVLMYLLAIFLALVPGR